MVRLRKSRLRLVMLAGLLAFGATVATVAHAAEASSVTFHGSTTPLTCSSNPDVTDLTIDVGEKVSLVNQTGIRATVVVGGVPGVSLDEGMAVRVKLKRGQHSVQLRPDCLTEGALGTLHVTVTRPSADDDDGEKPEEGEGSPSPKVSTSPAAVTRYASPESHAGPVVGQGAGSASTDTSPTHLPSPSSSANGLAAGADDDVPPIRGLEGYAFEAPYAVEPADDSRGEQLLALIALMCILGVAAATARVVRAYGVRSP